MNVRRAVARDQPKARPVQRQTDLFSAHIRRRFQAITDNPRRAIAGHALGEGVIGIDHRDRFGIQFLEQDCFRRGVALHRAVEIQMVLAQVRERSERKGRRRHAMLHKRVTGDFDDGMGAAGD